MFTQGGTFIPDSRVRIDANVSTMLKIALNTYSLNLEKVPWGYLKLLSQSLLDSLFVLCTALKMLQRSRREEYSIVLTYCEKKLF